MQLLNSLLKNLENILVELEIGDTISGFTGVEFEYRPFLTIRDMDWDNVEISPVQKAFGNGEYKVRKFYCRIRTKRPLTSEQIAYVNIVKKAFPRGLGHHRSAVFSKTGKNIWEATIDFLTDEGYDVRYMEDNGIFLKPDKRLEVSFYGFLQERI